MMKNKIKIILAGAFCFLVFNLNNNLRAAEATLPFPTAPAAQPEAPAVPTPVNPGQSYAPVNKTEPTAKENKQQSSRMSWSEAENKTPQPEQPKKPALTPEEARDQALVGSPQTGYAGTWTDPANGDIVTTVIAPAPQPGNAQNYPMVIQPYVDTSGWSNGYNYAGSGWPQWPTNPAYPGYGPYPGANPPPPPPPAPGYTPSYTPPPPQTFPNNFQPGYRPLQPGWNTPGTQPGTWQTPPPPGSWQTPPMGSQWSPQSPMPGAMGNNPSVWRPGASGIYQPMPGMGSNPAPLPLTQPGQTWNNGGNFGRPRGF